MRSILTLLLASCISLSACVLPEGTQSAAATGDAGPSPVRQRDAGVTDAAVKEREARDSGHSGAGGNPRDSGHGGAGGASDNAHEAGRGGAGGNSDTSNNSISGDAEDAGPSNAPEVVLKAHGETCATSAECASNNCKMSREGQRCYGRIAVDKACSGTYDCDGYECLPTTTDGQNGVCVDTSQCSSQNQCARDYWAATCQLDQLCSAQSISFDQCYQKACTRPRDSDDLCRSELATTKGLIASRCCPPSGAYHSSCDPAPQCGCQDGEKCDVIGAAGETACGPAGPGGELDDCERNRDCMAGYVCTNSGCSRYCDGLGDPRCTPTGACKPITIQQTHTPGSFVCTRTCDPTSPHTASGPLGACRSGQRCEPAADGYSDCFDSEGSGRQGASCRATANPEEQGCAPGFVCYLGTLSCVPYCKVAANDCEAGTCRSNPLKLFASDVEIGFCLAP